MTPGAATRVLLVGTVCSGKTSVGEALARRSGWPYLDGDVLLARSTGDAAGGPGAEDLRRAQANVLTMVLGIAGPLVASLPAGVVADPGERERLRTTGADVVWLRAKASTLVRRVGDRLGADPRAGLRELLSTQDPWFAEVARHVVDVEQHSPAQLAQTVLRAVRPA